MQEDLPIYLPLNPQHSPLTAMNRTCIKDRIAKTPKYHHSLSICLLINVGHCYARPPYSPIPEPGMTLIDAQILLRTVKSQRGWNGWETHGEAVCHFWQPCHSDPSSTWLLRSEKYGQLTAPCALLCHSTRGEATFSLGMTPVSKQLSPAEGQTICSQHGALLTGTLFFGCSPLMGQDFIRSVFGLGLSLPKATSFHFVFNRHAHLHQYVIYPLKSPKTHNCFRSILKSLLIRLNGEEGILSLSPWWEEFISIQRNFVSTFSFPSSLSDLLNKMEWMAKSSQAHLCKTYFSGPAPHFRMRKSLPAIVLFHASELLSTGQKECTFSILLNKEHLSLEIMAVKSLTFFCSLQKSNVSDLYKPPSNVLHQYELEALQSFLLWGLSKTSSVESSMTSKR